MGRFRIACHLILFWNLPNEGRQEIVLEEAFASVARAGYEGVEGVQVASADDLVEKAVLARKYGLQIVNTGAPDNDTRFKYNVTLGNRASGLRELTKRPFGAPQRFRSHLTDEQWQRVADELRPVARRAVELGVKPFHHSHMGQVIETVQDARRLLGLVPELTLLFDCGHLAAAGSDPRDALRDPALRTRIGHVHLKDTWVGEGKPAPGHGTDERYWHFEELGRGNVGTDFAALLSDLDATGYDGWVSVEQDRPTAHEPEEAARLNREFLKRLGY